MKLWSIETPDEAFLLVLRGVVVSTFKFGGNRRFFGADTASFVGCRGGTRAIPLLVVSDFRVSYVKASLYSRFFILFLFILFLILSVGATLK